jgi:hypothetical protein
MRWMTYVGCFQNQFQKSVELADDQLKRVHPGFLRELDPGVS